MHIAGSACEANTVHISRTLKKTKYVFKGIAFFQGLGGACLWGKLFLEWNFSIHNIGNTQEFNPNLRPPFYSEMIGGITRFLGVSGAIALGIAYGVRLGTMWPFAGQELPESIGMENEEYEDIREKEGDFFDGLAKTFAL